MFSIFPFSSVLSLLKYQQCCTPEGIITTSPSANGSDTSDRSRVPFPVIIQESSHEACECKGICKSGGRQTVIRPCLRLKKRTNIIVKWVHMNLTAFQPLMS